MPLPAKRLRIASLGVVLAALIPTWTAAAEPHLDDAPAIGASQWRQDIDILQRSLKTLHPGLYRYNTPAQIDGMFEALRGATGRNADFDSAYLAISELLAAIRCGHTYTNFGNQTDAVKERLYRHAPLLPFHFLWIDGRMVVTLDQTGNASLPRGTVIEAVNGVPTRLILSRLMAVARADGANDAKRIDYLQVQGMEEFEAFDIYFPLYFPPEGAAAVLTVRKPDSDLPGRMPVTYINHARRLEARRGNGMPSGAAAADWTLTAAAPDTAVLRMSTWALYNTTWDWRGFLADQFETLNREGTGNLIIDIRDNEGGLSEIGDTILGHLTGTPVALPGVVKRVSYRRVPDALRPYLSTWNPGFYDWGTQAIEQTDGSYRLQRPDDNSGDPQILPRPPNYRGRVWILIGATNSSATFEFAQRARQAGAARLVGEATGGNQRGINGGAFFFLRLPNSGIEVDVPLIGQFPESDRPDAGLLPDLSVPVRAEDVASGRDRTLEAALIEAGAGL